MSEKMDLRKINHSQSKPKATAAATSLRFQTLRHAFQREGAYLLPLRLFIGIGWLRAGLEKLADPSWQAGAALPKFFQEQLANDLIVFPFYQRLIEYVFEPNSLVLSWLIMLSECLVGLAILSGTFTSLALLGGIAMATNFILAGQVNPGAFYIVIQLILFIANSGAILGVDYWLSRSIATTLLVAQPKFQHTYHTGEKWFFLGLAGAFVFTALSVVPFIRDYSVGSVSDPAMILFVLAVIAAFSFLIAHVRLQHHYERRASDQLTDAPVGNSYHVVFCPRHPLYLASSALRTYAKGAFYQIASAQNGIEIRALRVEAEYVYLELDIAPRHDLSRVVNHLKVKCAIELTRAYSQLGQLRGAQFWSEGHYASKADLSETRIKRYVKSRRNKERDTEKDPLLAI